jgi:hypothetical protein
VDRDALAGRDVADDLVAWDGAAALGQPEHHVVDPLDLIPKVCQPVDEATGQALLTTKLLVAGPERASARTPLEPFTISVMS